ncbi:dTDP-glucose 4,6-dehydratase [Streptomyces clavuligerus]|uniref:dTDP-glucose 4,6-dehydratase n=1 Tax=Streptomyces clavuligerus TaxID=1901 RepID=B5GLJ1_STRCL|nr:dTDP-glucose 4,6-dehydratase [Streptomyces clavuligerus]EDY47187.1 NDP-glucose-4,6-dehydratase [Streptomyces clavuligerus]EFG04855.1 dTDP-glucose 4,6-dehydratase [Streptomyces clavuligerus]MBY6306702.1 dTDP-glucose 4,6-dehydratase [Streptomyces clavuligerus]QCS10691.1 dTDP-glucose 4,6-dehydratase [Streptomyces clavuligerus]QPJ97272.1 dTDP-glucose 4,6-dehydratase [Streptomyces clavuligerus]
MRLLVTGGAGFIGSHYVRTLLGPGYPGCADARVTVLDALTYAGRRDNVPSAHPRLEFVEGDVCDRRLLRELLPGHDAVIHFAAESHVDRSLRSADPFVRTNIGGTQTLLSACRDAGVERVVHVSTDEVYGSIERGSWTEDSPLLPNSPYAASKAGADLLARAYHQAFGMDVSITRCANNYGPYQHPEKLIPLFITHLMEGLDLPLYGDGRNIRDWVHVDDHCRAVHLVLTQGGAGEVYNIGGGGERSNIEVTEELLRLCGADRSRVRYVADRAGHDRRYSLDDSRIRERLGYAPRVGFASGLAETVAWYHDHADWWKEVKHRAR